jgi:hypothetical protein
VRPRGPLVRGQFGAALALVAIGVWNIPATPDILGKVVLALPIAIGLFSAALVARTGVFRDDTGTVVIRRVVSTVTPSHGVNS